MSKSHVDTSLGANIYKTKLAISAKTGLSDKTPKLTSCIDEIFRLMQCTRLKITTMLGVSNAGSFLSIRIKEQNPDKRGCKFLDNGKR